jgi:hypothetical protein
MKNDPDLSTEANSQDVENPRREFLRKSAKSAYIIPAVLLAVKASERPALAASGLGNIPV